MKWTKEQITQLTNLCMSGVSNKEIASAMDINIKDVYAKRSQLGITIDKCKPGQAQPEKETPKEEYPEWIEPTPTPDEKMKMISQSVEEAFNKLSESLLLEAIFDYTSLGCCAVYMTYSMLISDLKNSLNSALQAMDD